MAENNKGIGIVNAGVMGLVVGVAGGFAAAALSDKKNRQVVGKRLASMRQQAVDRFGEIKGGAQSMQMQAKKRLAGAKRTTTKKKNEVKKDMNES